jgi:hypothetical protein
MCTTRYSCQKHAESIWCDACSRPDLFKDLLDGIFNYDWNGDSNISKAISSLIENIVSADATFLRVALEMLLKSLLPSNMSLAIPPSGV